MNAAFIGFLFLTAISVYMFTVFIRGVGEWPGGLISTVCCKFQALTKTKDLLSCRVIVMTFMFSFPVMFVSTSFVIRNLAPRLI